MDLFANEMRPIMTGLMRDSFFFERGIFSVAGILDEATATAAYWAVYAVAYAILALKLLWKGFKIYILERDGDSEATPFHLVTGSGMALASAAAFPLLYQILVDVVIYTGNQVTKAFLRNADRAIEVDGILDMIQTIQDMGTTGLFAGLLLMIVVGLLAWHLMKRGVELLVFRLGIPLAAMDLVNSDGGFWRNYITILFRQAALSLTQLTLLMVGVLIFVNAGTLWSMIIAIVFTSTALGAPKLMAQIFPPSGSGGGMQKVSVLLSAARMIAS